MTHSLRVLLIALSALSLAGSDQEWKAKQFPEWTAADAKEVLSDSPWAKVVAPTAVTTPDRDRPARSGGGRRRGGGIGIGGVGVGIGMPGMGRAGRNNGANGEPSDRSSHKTPDVAAPSKLTLRWESALPMQEAELKAGDSGAPLVDEDHYVIAVYGIPRGMLTDDSKERADMLRRQCTLKPEGKKEIKPARVEILLRDDGPLIVYYFPRTSEITWRDHRVEFRGEVGKVKFEQAFSIDEMVFHGMLEL